MIVRVRTTSNPDICCPTVGSVTVEVDTIKEAVLFALRKRGFYCYILEVEVLSGTEKDKAFAKEIVGKINESKWGRRIHEGNM